MLKNHQRNCALVLLGSSLLLGSPFAAQASVYHADGTAGLIAGLGISPNPESYNLTLGVQAGGGVVFDQGTGMHATADSLADGYGVHSHTFAQMILPVAFGSSWDLTGSSTATATFSDMVVSGPTGGTVSTSLNMGLTGSFLFGSAADPGSIGLASVQAVVWVYVNGQLVGSGSHYEYRDTRFAPYLSTTGMLTNWGSGNPQFTTPNFDVQSGVPFDVQIRLSTSAEALVSSGNGTGGTAEANTDFSHTFSFTTSGNVFNLPIGYSANSADAHIVSNQVAAVPEPSSLALMAVAMGLGIAKRIRRRLK